MQLLLAARTKPFEDIFSVCNIGLSDAALERLADADAFRSVGLDRRQASWHISVKDKPAALFANHREENKNEQEIQLPLMQDGEQVLWDYPGISLSVKAHPVRFLREELQGLHDTINKELIKQPNGGFVKTAGLVIVQ